MAYDGHSSSIIIKPLIQKGMNSERPANTARYYQELEMLKHCLAFFPFFPSGPNKFDLLVKSFKG